MAKDYKELLENLDELKLTCEVKRELCKESPKRLLKLEVIDEIHQRDLQTIADAVDVVNRLTEIEKIVDEFFESPFYDYPSSAGYFGRILKVIRRKNKEPNNE